MRKERLVKYNAQQIITGAQEHVVKDLVIMPDWPHAERFLQNDVFVCDQPWFMDVCKRRKIELPRCTNMRVKENLAMEILKDEYSEYKNKSHGRSPDWFSNLSPRQKVFVRWEFWISDYAPVDNPIIVPGFEFTGIGYLIQEDGFIQDLINTFRLARLGDVKQLAFLHDPKVAKTEASSYISTFNQTRFLHVLDVGVLITLVGLNNRLPLKELLALMTAGYSHDWRTPAGGDTWKAINSHLFDEDFFYYFIFATPEFKEFKKKYGINDRQLYSIIQQEGVLGRILDLVDKIAYTARDVYYLLRQNPKVKDILFTYEFRRIRELVESKPLICSLWDCAEIRNGNLVVTDADRLSDFLKLRALMFRTLYYNPASRFLEDGLAKVLCQYLYSRKLVTLENLFTWGDSYLMHVMDQLVGKQCFFGTVSDRLHPRVERFATAQEARRREHEVLCSDSGVMTHIDESRLGKSLALESFLVWENGQAISFPKARPKDAQEIKLIGKTAKPFSLYVYSTKELRFPAGLAKDLRKEKQERMSS